MQSAQQQFNQWAKQQGIDARWAQVDISQRRLALQQNKPPKTGLSKFTPKQISDFRAVAADTAHDAFWGHIDPKTKKLVAEPQTYQDAMAYMLDHGIPLQIAQQSLNRYWKRPGYEADVDARKNGQIVWDRASHGKGRPLKSFQQRNPGKGGAAAETAALDTIQQTALAGQALSMIDPKLATPDNVRALVSRIQQESGGNPAAVNNWDSNAKAGHPSKGILQTIDSTFNAYAVPGHSDIWNPLDNALAAIRYMLSRYGHIVAANGKGY
jgi:hypothetical protein